MPNATKLFVCCLFFALPGVSYPDTAGDITGLPPGRWYQITDGAEDDDWIRDVLCGPAPCWDNFPQGESGGPTPCSGGFHNTVERKHCIWGGGHNDYLGNELYCFDFDDFTWSLEDGPSTEENLEACWEVDCDGYIADGKPESRHTYDCLTYYEGTNEMCSVGAVALTYDNGVAKGDLTEPNFDCYNFDTQTWTGEDNPTRPDTIWPSYSQVVTDASTGDIYAIRTRGDYDIFYWDRSHPTQPWSRVYNNVPLPRGDSDTNYSAAIDPVNHKLVLLGHDVYYVFDISTPGVVLLQTGCVDDSCYTGDTTLVNITSRPGVDLEYDPLSGLVIGYEMVTNRTSIYIINPVANTIEKVDPDPGNSVTPESPAAPSGIFGRMAVAHYLDEPLMHIVYRDTPGAHYRQYLYKLDHASWSDHNQLGGTGVLTVDTDTDSINFRLPVHGDRDGDATCSVQYRISGGGSYQLAQDLVRHRDPADTGATTNAFSGAVAGLNAGTAHDYILTVVDPDGGTKTYTGQAWTSNGSLGPVVIDPGPTGALSCQ